MFGLSSTRKAISGHETKSMPQTEMYMSTILKAKNFPRWKGEVNVLGFEPKFIMAVEASMTLVII